MDEYTQEEGRILLKLARDSIQEEINGIKPEIIDNKKFRQARGIFVRLVENGKSLEKVFLYPSKSVNELVYLAAKELAKKLKSEKFKIEISILTNPQPVNELKEISIGNDGLICNYLGISGFLMPQDAIKYNMDRIKFLEALCSNAGLPKDNWQNENLKLSKFQTQTFSE